MEQAMAILRGHAGNKPLVFELATGVHDIGRSSTCSVRIDESSVSRLHARLTITPERMVLEDLGSSNGTRVNGRELEAPRELKRGDRVSFGNIALMLEGGPTDTDIFLDQTQIRTGISVSIDEARATRVGERSKKAHLFSLLAEAGELMTAPHGPDAIFEPLLDIVARALQPERIFLLMQDDDPPARPRIAASRISEIGNRLAEPEGTMILSQTLLDQVIRQRAAFLTEDASQDERLLSGQSIISSGTRSAMAAPLFDNERVIGVLYADTSDPMVHYDRDELKAFVLLANVVAVAITHARYHEIEQERQRLQTELDAARGIMARLLPTELPEIAGLKLSVHLEPCEDVAGDLYDARLMPDGRLLLVVGDVSGKGLPAALIVAALLPALRLGSEDCRDVGCLVERVNEQLFASTDAIRFATLFLGLLDPRSGRLEYVNAGHNPPILATRDGALTSLAAEAPPVGMMPNMHYATRSCLMEPGQRLVFYSDGLTEATNNEMDMYGEERLQDLLASCTDCTLDGLRRRILDDVAAFTDGALLDDDLTLLLVERKIIDP